jgi:hypothetical protein
MPIASIAGCTSVLSGAKPDVRSRACAAYWMKPKW